MHQYNHRKAEIDEMSETQTMFLTREEVEILTGRKRAVTGPDYFCELAAYDFWHRGAA